MSQSEKPRVLLVNAYDMEKVYRSAKTGQFPGHHLFGTLELEADYNVELVIDPFVKYPVLNRIGKWFDIELLDQQVRAAFALRKCDLLYAPYAATNTKLIVILKLLGIIRKPVMILVHQPLFGKPAKQKWKRLLVRKLIEQYDKIVFFNSTMNNEVINAYNFSPDFVRKHFAVEQWGVDFAFFKKFDAFKIPSPTPFVFSSGNTGRDFDILVRVAARIKNVAFKIYCKPESHPKATTIPSNVEILSGEFPFEQICRDQANAQLVLIPITPNIQGMLGYTSLLDAIALGNPVIMTRNKYIDLDLEREGIGITVEENDDEGWYTAIVTLLADNKLRSKMSKRCLELGQEKFNINVLARTLASSIADACGVRSQNEVTTSPLPMPSSPPSNQSSFL